MEKVKNIDDPGQYRAWYIYDWADSAYFTTVIAAFLPVYFVKTIVPKEGVEVFGHILQGQTLWAYCFSLVTFVNFITLPFLGRISDLSNSKKYFMSLFVIFGGISCLTFYDIGAGKVWQSLATLFICQVCSISALVFYQGFLPQIASNKKISEVALRGSAIGFFGGGVQFALSVAIVMMRKKLGISLDEATRIGLAFAGLWWLAFGLLSIWKLKEEEYHIEKKINFENVFVELWLTLKKIYKDKPFMTYLIAYFFFIDGVQASISLTAVYAAQTLKLPSEKIMMVFLMIQFLSFAGSHLFRVVDQKLGSKNTLWICVFVYTLACYMVSEIPEGNFQVFAGLAVIVGLCQGGIYPISRAVFARLIPPKDGAQYFGFFSVFSKFSAIWAPLVYALLVDLTGSGRWGVKGILIFLILGLLVLTKVDLKSKTELAAA